VIYVNEGNTAVKFKYRSIRIVCFLGMMILATHNVVCEKLKNIVGSKNVTDREVILDAYMGTVTISAAVGAARQAEMRVEAVAQKRPGFIVNAGTKEEVQEIVRIANQYKVPIIPVGAFTSTYYETTPIENAIMLDMSRMKKIEIDEDIMTVTIEPGVTWAQAYRDMAIKGYWVSAQASPGPVHILGSTSQAGYHLPMNKHAVNFSSWYSDLTIGAEIVLPTGELLVTGSASLPGARPQSARAFGPNLAAIFLGAQGTLGVIVKQTLPLWRIPEAHVFVQGNFKDENFKGLTNAMQKAMDDQNAGIAWAERVWAIYDGTQEPLEWELYVQIFGSKEEVDFYRKWSEKIILEEGGTIIPNPRILEVETDYSPQLYEEFIYWRPRANSIVGRPPEVGNLMIGGMATHDKLPELHGAAVKLLAKHGFKINTMRKGLSFPQLRNANYQNVSLSFAFDANDPEEMKRAKAVREEWVPILNQIAGKQIESYAMAEAGGAVLVYRLTPAAAKTGLPMLGEYYKLLVKLKRMLDPNRIMNPGKFMDIEP
jgi:FAD/FMN-containing dehydrogenase